MRRLLHRTSNLLVPRNTRWMGGSPAPHHGHDAQRSAGAAAYEAQVVINIDFNIPNNGSVKKNDLFIPPEGIII
ncbi:MAG: hypothetical protein EB127_19540 [Alphaproteobacteria bacterium]|nr:hypothetical protein [Alphaproteobacteria bacterium]